MDTRLFNHFVETEACSDQSEGTERMLSLIPQVPGLMHTLQTRWRRVHGSQLRLPAETLEEGTAAYAAALAEFYAAMGHALSIGYAAGYSYAQTEAAGNISGASLDELDNVPISTIPLRSETWVQNTADGWVARCPHCTWFQLVAYRRGVPATEPKPLELARAAAREHVCAAERPSQRTAA
jgi:hypothetical protein